jgi:hypothetical protein
MKVLDLSCANQHTFEGWFSNEEDYQGQRERGILQCPVCGSDEVHKRLSAPRLNLGASIPVAPKRSSAETAPAHSAESPLPADLQAAWLKASRRIMSEVEDVGSRFAQEARSMHYGDAPERPIRGQSNMEETVQLIKEGIPVLPLALPDSAKETLQ